MTKYEFRNGKFSLKTTELYQELIFTCKRISNFLQGIPLGIFAELKALN
jgi:hypothetical protein